MRLIDADALEITEEYEWIEDEDGLEDEIYWRYYAEETIENAPSIEIVRCGECRHFDDRHGEVCHNERFGDGWGNYPPPCVNADGGCSYGERRDDG